MKKILISACLAITSLSLSADVKIMAFAASTRKDSYNKKLVNDAAEIARKMGATVTVIDLEDYPMPFYDGDLEMEQGMPENVQRFRQLMISSDGIIIASPEYNGSIPGLLKNALDWASRNEEGDPSREAFKGKKFAIMSASPGGGGGNRGLVHLRNIIENMGGTVVPEQVTIPHAHQYFSEERAVNPLLRKEIQQLVQPKLANAEMQ